MKKFSFFTALSVSVLLIVLLQIPVKAQDDSYYSALNPTSGTFITDLKNRLRTPYTQISYDQFDETNVANFSSFDNGNGTRTVYCVYSKYPFVYSGTFAWGVMSREHTWCHSWMPSYSSESTNEYQDQHHLFPTQQNNANGVRSNHPLGIVANATSTFYECKYGTNTSGQNVFESRNPHKGDAARALLYMCVRYDGTNGNTWTFNWLNGTRLPGISEAPQDLNLLLQWHRDDPPDKWEVDRNNYVQGIQKNRNPLVDHPEYTAYINFNDLTALTPSYAAEPTNYATAFAATATGTSITLSWTDAAAGTQVPDGYLIEAFAANNYFIPIDGSTYSDRTTLSTDTARVNIAYSADNTYTFTGLTTGKTYYFRMYAYTGSGSTINYKTTGNVPSANATITGTVTLATEPANNATGMTAGSFSSSGMTLSWTDAVTGTQAPSGYLLLGNTTNSFTAPVDGAVYSDDTDFSDGSFTVTITAPTGGSYALSSLSPATTYYYKLYAYNGTGAQRNYKTDGTIASASGTTSAAVPATEPANHVTGLAAGSATTSSIPLTWTDAVSGAQAPSGYLLLANTTGSFTTPADGTVYSDDTNLVDGSAAVNISAPSSGAYTFSSLSSSTTYYFRMYSYNGSGSQRNYKTDGTIPNTSATTSAVVTGSYAPVLLDNFNRTASSTLGNLPNAAVTTPWNESETVSPTSIAIASNRAEMGSATAGREYATVNLSSIAGYPVKLSTATQTMTWAWNMRQSRSNPSGFDNNTYGQAFILGADTNDINTANGYAVIFGQSSSDYLKLAKFTGGLTLNTKFTAIITAVKANTNPYMSLRVTYNPSNNQWNLYSDTSLTAFTTSDPRTVQTSLGSATDNTYIASSLKYLGLLWNHNTVATDVAYFDDIYISDPGGALPVELTGFSASAVQGSVVLRWKTATEVNNHGFYVLRSADSKNWEIINFVAGAGNSNTEREYRCSDKPAAVGTWYYRLKQVDNDGSESLSEIASVVIAVPKTAALYPAYPNPFNPETRLHFAIPNAGMVSLVVYDILGNEIKTICNEYLPAGDYTRYFVPGSIGSGVYMLVLKTPGFTAAQKLVYLR